MLKEEKIDCCMKGCMLYYKDDIALTHWKFYEELSFKPKRKESGRYKDDLKKRMHYLSLIPRLKGLYVSMSSAVSTVHEIENDHY